MLSLLALSVDYRWSAAQQTILTKCALGVDISFRAKVLSAHYLPTEHWRLALVVDAVSGDACIDSINGMKLRGGMANFKAIFFVAINYKGKS